MLTKPIEVLEQFPVRKSKKQKEAFRDAVLAYAKGLGYDVAVEKVSRGAKNIIIGDPENAKYLITAHYDTPASIGIPNILTPCNPVAFIVYQVLVVALYFAVSIGAALLTFYGTQNDLLALLVWYIVYFGMLALMMFGPANKHNANDNTSGVVTLLETSAAIPVNVRDEVCFALFDLEEAGLVGSAGHRKAHKTATEKQIVLNLDCVGDGQHILFFPVNKAKKNTALVDRLQKLCTRESDYRFYVRTRGFAAGSSDHKKFPLGVGIMAFHRNRVLGYYCDKIHTCRDKTLNYDNVTLLRDMLTEFICQHA